MKAIRLALALMILALPLSSCGKKALPKPPGAEPQTYPQVYPYDPSQPQPPQDSNQ
ncbi:MAG: hypothetical protein ABSG66_12555 [Stellaceae bacterium]